MEGQDAPLRTQDTKGEIMTLSRHHPWRRGAQAVSSSARCPVVRPPRTTWASSWTWSPAIGGSIALTRLAQDALDLRLTARRKALRDEGCCEPRRARDLEARRVSRT